MTTTNVWGVPVIGAGDGILEAWKLLADTGIRPNVPVASVAAARTLLTQAEAQGVAPTSTTPAYFDINGIIYRSTGEKNGGAWILAPVNEVGRAEDSYSLGETISRGANQQNALITSTLGTADYDRVVFAFGMAAGDCTAGSYNLCILINNTDGQLSRWDSGSGLQSQTAINMGYVAAGAAPQVILAVRSGSASSNVIKMNNNAAANKLMVIAFPVAMD